MKIDNRIAPLTKALLGGAGVVLCLATVVAAYWVVSKVHHATNEALVRVDRSLTAGEEKVTSAAKHVQEAKITSQEIEDDLKTWAKTNVQEEVASRLDIEEKTRRLAAGVAQADKWLAISESSMQFVQQGLDLVGVGSSDKERPIDKLLTEIASLRTQATQVADSVDSIGDHLSEAGEEKSLKDRIEQASRVAARVLATLGTIETRLENTRDRIPDIRIKIQNASDRVWRWTRAAAIGIALLALWMAAGQYSLCRSGWKGLRSE